ncbi:hypothetical protein GCM10010140_17420 [Streptosporangium pseudovulgare]|nr:hypothetical protein GCM10010140_17420 [Streptosporangium pseudovulgare]
MRGGRGAAGECLVAWDGWSIWHTGSRTEAVPVPARARPSVLTAREAHQAADSGDPATALWRGKQAMKPDIHPDYNVTEVTCTCGNTFTTRSTAKNGVIHADVCSACHPFYTGKQKILDTGGRVARFEKRFGKKTTGQ